MMVATFNGNPSATIICYSPTKVIEDTDHCDFYKEHPPLFVAFWNTVLSSFVET